MMNWTYYISVFNNGWNSRDIRKKVSFNDSIQVGSVLTPYTEYQRVQRPHQANSAAILDSQMPIPGIQAIIKSVSVSEKYC